MRAIRVTAVTARAAATVASRDGRRHLTVDARVVRQHRLGHALSADVLKVDTVRLDSASLKPSEVLVKMLAAPITPTDLSSIAGFGSKKVALPAAAGHEGVGVVLEAGERSTARKGDYVVASRPGIGTWATHVIASDDSWTVVTGGNPGDAAFPVEVAAASVASPITAKLLVGGLSGDSVLVQNNGASTVGQCVIQYAAAKGIKTVNILRHRNDWDAISNHLQGLGAGVVVSEQMAGKASFRRLLADYRAISTGLDGVGGTAARLVASSLTAGGRLVVYGSMARQPVSLSADALINRGVTVTGFSLERVRESYRGRDKEWHDLVNGAIADVRQGKIKQLLARESFGDFAQALRRALAPGERKVVLVMP